MNKNTKRNTKTVTTKTTQNKEEKNMKKNTEIVGGASVTMTKKGCATIVINQPIAHGAIYQTIFGVTTEIKSDIEKVVADYKNGGFTISEIVKHDEKVDYSSEYKQRVASINNPTLENKKSDEKQPTTYKEAIEKKYGSEDHRKAVGAMTKVIASEWREQYLKTGKVVCKRSEYRQKLWAEAEKRVAEAEKKA